MLAIQRKRRATVIECPVHPSARIVATGAVGRVCALVAIVLAVTAGAVGRGIPEARTFVARRAGQADVLADQGEWTQAVVETHGTFPGRGTVTGGAVGSQLADMRVIRPMAVDTGRSEPGLPWRQLVAGCADDAAMRSGQREPGLSVVVERRRLPAGRLVTLLADGPVAALVNVVGGVTAGAIGRPRRFARRSGAVTGSARQGGMPAGEAKSGSAVIKPGNFPGARSVTIGARGPEAAGMNILVPVAPDAGWRRTSITALGVTAVAGRTRMGSTKRKAGPVVVEARRLPGNRPVTVGAGRSERSLVGVIPAMTGGAGGRRTLEGLVRMTGQACGPRMGARQRKSG